LSAIRVQKYKKPFGLSAVEAAPDDWFFDLFRANGPEGFEYAIMPR